MTPGLSGSKAPRELIDHACSHCGYHVTVEAVVDVLVCPSCECLDCVQPKALSEPAQTTVVKAGKTG